MDCGTLTDPANGQVNNTAGTTFGQTATYTCDIGYNLVGENTRICQADGIWSGIDPLCQGMLLLGLSAIYLCSNHCMPGYYFVSTACSWSIASYKLLHLKDNNQGTWFYTTVTKY